MPTFDYQCTVCKEYQEQWIRNPAPDTMEDGDCQGTGKPCKLQRKWSPPNIGFIQGAGFSPARNSRKKQ